MTEKQLQMTKTRKSERLRLNSPKLHCRQRRTWEATISQCGYSGYSSLIVFTLTETPRRARSSGGEHVLTLPRSLVEHCVILCTTGKPAAAGCYTFSIVIGRRRVVTQRLLIYSAEQPDFTSDTHGVIAPFFPPRLLEQKS